MNWHLIRTHFPNNENLSSKICKMKKKNWKKSFKWNMFNWSNNQSVPITNECLNIYLQNEKVISLVKICLGEDTKTWTGTCLSRYLPCYLSLLYSTESRHFLSDFLLSLTFWCYFSIRYFVSTMKKIKKILRN